MGLLFVLGRFYTLFDLRATFLNTTVPSLLLHLPLLSLTYQTRHSHTHGDGWPGHPASLRGVPVRESPAAVSQTATLCSRLEGLWWVNPRPKRGQGPRWRQGGERAAWSTHATLSLHNTRGEKSWHVLDDPYRTHRDDAAKNKEKGFTSYS